MRINKLLATVAIVFSTLISYAQEIEFVGDERRGAAQLHTGQPILNIADPNFSELNVSPANLRFTSVDPAVYIHLGFDESIPAALTSKGRYYSCQVVLEITPFSKAGVAGTPFNTTLEITHNNYQHTIVPPIYDSRTDYVVYKVPGIHKASVKVLSMQYQNVTPENISKPSYSAVHLKTTFKTQRYFNLKDSNIGNLTHKLIRYNAMQEQVVTNVSDGAHELKITWDENAIAPATEYELEWTWIDSYAPDGNTLNALQVDLTELDFRQNSTRVEIKSRPLGEPRELSYNIPLLFPKGYLVYRVRPIGRFLDAGNILKPYFGNWSSGVSDSYTVVANWPHKVTINQEHELGKKNWQYQASYAEKGKKKDVVSYFDGSLRNRQTVTKINTNQKTVVGEVIYDNQGRPAIEVLPVPLQESAIKYYGALNKNTSGVPYSHNDFDWDSTPINPGNLEPVIPGMSNVSGASKYYSENNTVANNFNDFVPNAENYPFSQVEYTADNTGRIKRKGGVGPAYRLGTGHEMQYFYAQADSEELNRLFGYKIGNNEGYKKNIVIDPNKQVSVSYIDPQGRTVATALAGDSPTNLTSLPLTPAENNSFMVNLLSNNTGYASGINGPMIDGKRVSKQVEVIKDDTELQFTYNPTTVPGSFVDPTSCVTGIEYPFVYDWSMSLTNDYGLELLPQTRTGTGNIINVPVFTLPGKKIGLYSLTKDIHINQTKLDQYTDDYIAKLKNASGPGCKPSSSETTIVLENCEEVTCRSCEQSFVGAYLNQQDQTNFYNSFGGSDVNSLDVNSLPTRETYILKAENAYALQNLQGLFPDVTFTVTFTTTATSPTPSEINAKVAMFKAAFRSLLLSCRQMCTDYVSETHTFSLVCNVNDHMLLADVSPHGQYGSIKGLETIDQAQGSSTLENESQDVLSLYNERNMLLYGGYQTENFIDQDTNESQTQNRSKFTWRNPEMPYKDEDGQDSKIRIRVIEEGVYDIEVAENAVIENDINPDTKLIKPIYLKNVGDFINNFKDSWAKSLLPYHPEFYYYLYNKAVCEQIVSQKNSDTFDESLPVSEDLDSAALSTLFSQTGLVKQIVDSYNLIDPYYTPQNLYTTYNSKQYVVETNEERSMRTTLMNEAMYTKYDGISYQHGGTSYNLNMLKAAYYTAAFSNGIAPSSVYHTALNGTTNQVITYIHSNLNDELKRRIWDNFRSNYIGMKQKTRTVFSHIYALRKNRYNDCIGNQESTDSFVTLFKKYSNYGALHGLIQTALNTTAVIPSGSTGIEVACSNTTSVLYKDKVKRFTPADHGYNSGVDDDQALADALADANTAIYLQTGRCPLTTDLENLLNGVLKPTIQPNGLIFSGLPTYSMPFLTRQLYSTIFNPTSNPNPNDTQTIRGIIQNSVYNLQIGVANGGSFNQVTVPIQLKFIPNTTFVTGCGVTESALSWSSYGTSFKIVGFKNLYYIPGSFEPSLNLYKFRIVALVKRLSSTSCELLEEVVLEGTTQAPIGECGFFPGGGLNPDASTDSGIGCTNRNNYEKALVRIMNKLHAEQKLFTTATLNGGTNHANNPYLYNESILPELIEDPNLQAVWSYNQSETEFTITLPNPAVDVVFKLNLTGITTFTQQKIVRILAVNVTKNVDGDIIYPDEVMIYYLYNDQNTYRTGSVTGTMTPINLDCECRERVTKDRAFASHFQNLLNHLFTTSQTTYIPGIYPATPFLPLLEPYLSINQPVISKYNSFNQRNRGIYFDLTNDVINHCGVRLMLEEFVPNIETTYYENVTGLSNLQITGNVLDSNGNPIEGQYTFSVHVHHNEWTSTLTHDDHSTTVTSHPAGVNIAHGTISCVENAGCLEAINFENSMSALVMDMINVSNGNGSFTDGSQHSILNAIPASVFNFSDPARIYSFKAEDDDLGSYLSFDFTADRSCGVDIMIPGIKLNEIAQISKITFDVNSPYKAITVIARNVANEIFFGSGTIDCLKLESCYQYIQVPCVKCVPPTVSPISCAVEWEHFVNEIADNTANYTLPQNILSSPQYFCQANLGYISSDYLYYLNEMGVISFGLSPVVSPDDNTFFLPIERFGLTALNYGNPITRIVIDAYKVYADANTNLETLMSWNEFANKYVKDHENCSPLPFIQNISLETVLTESCEVFATNLLGTYQTQVAEDFYANKREVFRRNYINQAMGNLQETLVMKNTDKEYQYTLYYYDQAGNLIQTVPPEGVNRLSLAAAASAEIDTIRLNNAPNPSTLPTHLPVHTGMTKYKYNSLNQLVWQSTPDGGITVFAYDALGRIIASQNANQAILAPQKNVFSYTRYDKLGRIFEAGQFQTAAAIFIDPSGKLVYTATGLPVPVDAVNNRYPYSIASLTEEVTRTLYDNALPGSESTFTAYGSDNNHKRVTAILYFDQFTAGSGGLVSEPIHFSLNSAYKNAILYDYDVHGNVRELVLHYNNASLKALGQDIKKVTYDYDLISGNVNKVIYQPGKSDQFIHKYDYDADNRITKVFTSKEGIIWEKDADYKYYDHGPLARIEIGDKTIQGVDYFYTLQGWLKGVNSESLDPTKDIGKDSYANNSANDAFAYTLNYFQGDYKSRFNTTGTGDNNIFTYSKGYGKEGTVDLFNGNIKEMVTTTMHENHSVLPAIYTRYGYDQLNRLVSMVGERQQSVSTPETWISGHYMNLSYDRNGNIKTLVRRAPRGSTSYSIMDNLTYRYQDPKSVNRLTHVDDSVTNADLFAGDVEDQAPNNYTYDEIGQLKTDVAEGLSIDWRVDGKVKKITKATGDIISFEYDGLGNRIGKTETISGNTTSTFYNRDASGNVLSTYDLVTEGSVMKYYLKEQNIYGASRLGYEQGSKTALAESTLNAGKSNSRTLSKGSALNIGTQTTLSGSISGLNFNGSNQTLWTDKISLFQETGPLTEMIKINTHFKIKEYSSTNPEPRQIVVFDHAEPPAENRSYNSMIRVMVAKNGDEYRPIIVIERHKKTYNRFRPGWGKPKKWTYRNYLTTVRYELKKTIPQNEWDMKLTMTRNGTGFDPVLVLNGNTYKLADFTVQHLTKLNGGESKRSGDFPMPPPTSNHLGSQFKLYGNAGGDPISIIYPGLPMEMCDFSYTIDNGDLEPQDPPVDYVNEFTFDGGTTGANMGLVSAISGGMTMGGSVPYSAGYCGPNGLDTDGDGINDAGDNCPLVFNPDQTDSDGDGFGDACDKCATSNSQADNDNDGIGNSCDNCPDVHNVDQVDSDGDGIGNQCDNCPFIANPGQEDTDNDGIGNACEGLDQGVGAFIFTPGNFRSDRLTGDKRYELSDHLGNVHSVFTDRKIYSTGDIYRPDVIAYYNYYPFGMLIPNRHSAFPESADYRYGYNGKEKEDNIKGEGNSYDFGARMLDPRLGRFFTVDPKMHEYEYLSPYTYAANNPIFLIDRDGENPFPGSSVPVTRELFIKIVKANGFELNRRPGESNDDYGRRYTITLGHLFEKNVLNVLGLKKNTKHIYPYKYNKEYVIPDAVEASRYQKVIQEKIFGLKYNKVKYALDFEKGLFFEAKFSKNVMFEQEFNPLQFRKQIDALASTNKATKYTDSGQQEVNAKATDYGAAVLSLITPSDAVIDKKLIEYATKNKVLVIRYNLEFGENGNIFDEFMRDSTEPRLKDGSFSLSKGEYLNPEIMQSKPGTRNQGSRQIGSSKDVIAN